MTRAVTVRRERIDLALAIYVLLLLGIPSELVVRPLGAAGTPAQILAIGLLAVWLGSQLVRPRGRGNPIKRLLLLFVIALLSSYVAGMTRAVVFTEEINSADRAMLSLCAWCGVVLVMSDGLPSREKLDPLLRLVAGGATGVAVLGMLQFFFQLDIAHLFHIPGLSANQALGGTLARSSFQRVAGTASHPIEFGVVLSAALPLLLHFARFSASAESRRRWWVAVGIVAFALPLSVARSGMIGGAIVAVMLIPTWPAPLRRRAVVWGGIGVVAMSFAVPGLLGTIRGLFLNAGSDPSTQGRTADYGPVMQFVAQRPFFGRGIGTFIPGFYRTLDNQYLGLLVEAGLVGLLATLTLVLGAAITGGAIRRRCTEQSDRDLAQGLTVGVVVIGVNAATFDAFGFAMCAGMLFILIGALGSLWSMHPSRPDSIVVTSTHRPPLRIRRGVLVGSGALVVLLASGLHVLRPQVQYQAHGSVVLVPAGKSVPAYTTSGQADVVTSVLHDALEAPQQRAALRARGVEEYEVAVGDGSLMMGTDVRGTGGPTLRLVVSADDPRAAERGLADVIDAAGADLTSMQRQADVSSDVRISVQVVQQDSAVGVIGRPSRAKLASVVLAVLLAYLTWTAFVPAPARPGARRRPNVRQRAAATLRLANSSV